ncbi:hypothetical protein LINGRAHAP2_LOCUS7991 [Linum grandiflorum]
MMTADPVIISLIPCGRTSNSLFAPSMCNPFIRPQVSLKLRVTFRRTRTQPPKETPATAAHSGRDLFKKKNSAE